MARKPTRKEKIEQQKQQTQTEGAATRQHPQPRPAARSASQRQAKIPLLRPLGLIVFFFAFLLYANTLNHQYALDDYGVIVENEITKQGYDAVGTILKSGYRTSYTNVDVDLYRPLSRAMFAIEWGMSPDSPGLSHFVNVLLFALTCLLLFRTLCLYLPQAPLFPFLVAMIFAAHPIHTEAVANIKGRDEILSFLFTVVTLFFVHRFSTSGKRLHLVLTGVAFFLAFLSKESTITFLAVVPLMLYFFTNAGKKTYLPVLGVLVSVTLVFLLIRHQVLAGGSKEVVSVDNYLAGISDPVSRFASAVFMMGVYLKQLFVPHPLICDGSISHFPVVGAADWQFLVSFLVYAALAGFAIWKFKKKNIFAFAVLYFFATVSVISNIVFQIGTNYGERLLYAPSLALCIAVAAALMLLLNKDQMPSTSGLPDFFKSAMKPVAAAGAIVLVFGVLTFLRNPDWFNNRTLYTADLQHAPNSAKLHYYFGNHITQEDEMKNLSPKVKALTFDTAIAEFRKSLACYPRYHDPAQKLGQCFFDLSVLDSTRRGYVDSSERYYRKALEIAPGLATIHNNYGRMLFSTGRVDLAEAEFRKAISLDPNYDHAENNLASTLGTQASALVTQGQKDSLHRDSLFARARALFESSVTHSKRAIAINPTFVDAYRTTAMTYRFLGDNANAQLYQNMADEAQKKNPD